MKSVLSVIVQLTILCSLLSASETKVSEELRVVLSHGGGVIGKYITSQKGNGIRAFLSVPFAEPPVGPLRFANPKPKVPWKDYIEATVDNKMCPQPVAQHEQTLIADEDCLYLNVFTPSVRKV